MNFFFLMNSHDQDIRMTCTHKNIRSICSLFFFIEAIVAAIHAALCAVILMAIVACNSAAIYACNNAAICAAIRGYCNG